MSYTRFYGQEMVRWIIVLMFLSSPFLVSAQDPVRDSLKLYKDIERFAQKSKFRYWVYSNIFLDPTPDNPSGSFFPNFNTQAKNAKADEPFQRINGKVIRNIEIVTMDPFQTDTFNISYFDTVPSRMNFIKKGADRLHLRTNRMVIRNQLLFKKGDRVDPLKISESERIIRSATYIRDCKIKVADSSATGDSVDLKVIVQDAWSIDAFVIANSTSGKLYLSDKNFAGAAHEIGQTVNYSIKNKDNLSLQGNYLIRNIGKTFLTTSFDYSMETKTETGSQRLNISRSFYSPLTEWAGGVMVAQNIFPMVVNNLPGRARNHLRDYWAGTSIKFKPGQTDVARSTRFVVTGRVYQSYYKDVGDLSVVNKSYPNTILYLGSFSFSARKYYQDNYIFRFGRNEDVPEGRLLTLTFGAQKQNGVFRNYSGIKVSAGNHIERFGYVSATAEYGTFLKGLNAEKGIAAGDLIYFTDLIRYNRWLFRQYLYFRVVHGIRRDSIENITLNSRNELFGYSPNLLGTSKGLVSFRSVVYPPWKFIEFKMGVILFSGFGLIGREVDNYWRKKVHQSYGIGLLIMNDHMIFRNFQISFGFYPNLDDDHARFKYNPVTTYDLYFRDFYPGSPDIVGYY